MTEAADGHPMRGSETIYIKVFRVRNLVGQKGDTLTTMVNLEFGDRNLGNSPRVECTPDNPAELNHQVSLNVTFEDPHVLDDVCTKPITFTVLEALPKEKKQARDKEEKSLELGKCTVDLFPLVKGETTWKQTLAIVPSALSPIENLPPEHATPELDVCVWVDDALLTEAQLKDTNLMTVTVESLFCPPDSFQITGPQYNYHAVMPVPIAAEKEQSVVFTAGQLKPGLDKETPNKQKRWAIPGNAQGSASYIPNRCIPSEPIEDEDGDFRSREDREMRHAAETDKNRITWNIERRCYMEQSAVRCFQDKIVRSRYWPVEIFRTPLPAAGKGGKGGKDDEGAVSFHGVAYVNLAPLLYPGVKRIRGAYKVVSFLEHELTEKTFRKGSLADEAVRLASVYSRTVMSPGPKKGAKGEEKKDQKKQLPRQASGMVKQGDGSEGDVPQNLEGQQYTDSHSYVMLEVELNRPLVRKRQPEELARRVAEYIPPRPMYPKRTNGAQLAVEDFQKQVGSVAGLVLEEFRQLYGDELRAGTLEQTTESAESRRQKLIYELNASGKYFAFKEQLKHAVVKIVREKYLKTTTFTDREQLQAFLSELYVYLVDQMHVGLDRVLCLENQEPVPEPLTDSEQLKHFAKEAEVNQNYELATRYYQERIARNKNDPEHWYDYGVFCLNISDVSKAEECLKECIAIDQKHLNGLMLYGVIMAIQEKNESAETFFEAATCVNPKSVLAWTMFGLFYDGIGNEIGAENALLEANKLNIAAARAIQEEIKTQHSLALKLQDSPRRESPAAAASPMHSEAPGSEKPSDKQKGSAGRRPSLGKKARPMSSSKESSSSARPPSKVAPSPQVEPPAPEPNEEEPPPREPTPVPENTIYMQAADFCLSVKAVAFAERALGSELLAAHGGPSCAYFLNMASVYVQRREFDKARQAISEALEFDYQHPDAWGLLGHLHYLQGQTADARDCYERTLSLTGDASETHAIYLRLASIYLQEQKYQEAKTTFLMACKRSPSAVSWLGVGIACFRLEELSEAEDALSEANVLNNYDPEVWAYLSLVCLRTDRQVEAEQAYKYALKLRLEDAELIEELRAVQQEVGFGNPEL